MDGLCDLQVFPEGTTLCEDDLHEKNKGEQGGVRGDSPALSRRTGAVLSLSGAQQLVSWASGTHPSLTASESHVPATGRCFSSDWSVSRLFKLL